MRFLCGNHGMSVWFDRRNWMDCHVRFRGKATHRHLRVKMLRGLEPLGPDSLESWWSVDHCLSSWTLLGGDFIY